MNQRDWELLDKELWGVSPGSPRNSGMIGLAFAAAFLVGIATGGFLFPHESKQMMQIASYDETAAISLLNGVPSPMR
jgi:hypothetical protein